MDFEVKCDFCGKIFFRTKGRINESRKFKWKYYCSIKCQSSSRTKQIKIPCTNPMCKNTVSRTIRDLEKSKSGNVFCSKTCAAIINNKKRRRDKFCPICGKELYGERNFCSKKCRLQSIRSKLKKIKVSDKQIVDKIKEFYKTNKRIPLKREFVHYNAARLRFGSWNNAIKSAEFKPNPVLFSRKYIAKDGHKCDSFAEKIIDDWLFSNKITHERNISYPGNNTFTADFLIKDYLVEFFGLSGQVRKYDKLVSRKKNIVKKHKLKLIEIYPNDICPINKLNIIFKEFLNRT